MSTVTSHTSGAQVIHTYFAPCILSRMVVATQKRDGGEQLVGDAEQRPQRIDAAQWIAHALDQKVAPRGHDRRAGRDHSRHPARAAQRRHDVAQQSCSMKRPTRVPASMMVRMKSASNMMAK